MSAAPSPQGILPAPTSAVRRWLSRTVAVLYGLVMFEVIIMISPFAFYFYAAYGPTLKWLNHSRATAWLTGFVLPHAVFTTSPFLEFLRWDLGRYAFGLGLVGFFFFAVQIYGSRLFRRKVVTSGVYRYIRHPQYLCLNISAFGLFTMWPRVIIFLLFVGMLFAYYYLARVEEQRMLILHPGYAEYMRGTGMFLPGNPGGRVYALLFGGMRDRSLSHRLAIGSLALMLLLTGIGLRAYTLGHISRSTGAANMEVISVYPMTAEAMQHVVALALADSRVEEALHREPYATFVVHILPHNYGMMGMFADVESHHMRPGNIHLSRFKYLAGCLLPFLDVHSGPISWARRDRNIGWFFPGSMGRAGAPSLLDAFLT
jgi:protein-S-isoprenylcysteine O-methyltransferase Ste14